MEAVYTYRGNYKGFVIQRVLIKVIAFFVISFTIYSLAYFSFDPTNYYSQILQVVHSDAEIQAANAKVKELIGFNVSYPISYPLWMRGILTRPWGLEISQLIDF